MNEIGKGSKSLRGIQDLLGQLELDDLRKQVAQITGLGVPPIPVPLSTQTGARTMRHVSAPVTSSILHPIAASPQ